jgi:hypothetical protein
MTKLLPAARNKDPGCDWIMSDGCYRPIAVSRQKQKPPFKIVDADV